MVFDPPTFVLDQREHPWRTLSQRFVFRRSKNFTSRSEIQTPPTVPINHYFGPEHQQNRTKVLYHYSMLHYSRHQACFEHSIFLKVNEPVPGRHQTNGSAVRGRMRGSCCTTQTLRPGGAPPAQKSNYELFNCNNFSIRYWSWNYRGCWHQTCPPIVPR